MFDPRTFCSPALFFHPWTHTAAGLLARLPPPAFMKPGDGMPGDFLSHLRLPVGKLEEARRLPAANAHFVLLEDDAPKTLLAFMTAWEQGPPHRHLAFWIPRHLTSRHERAAAVLLNGMRVPDDPELVSGWLSDHLKRPATWAELTAVLNFLQGLPAEAAVLDSTGIAKFFGDHGGREAARAQFVRLQHQCLQVLAQHHRDALLEKNLAVVVFARRGSLLAGHAERAQWAQLAQALGVAVVPVSCETGTGAKPTCQVFTVHEALGGTRDAQEPAWIQDADAVWKRVNPAKGKLR